LLKTNRVRRYSFSYPDLKTKHFLRKRGFLAGGEEPLLEKQSHLFSTPQPNIARRGEKVEKSLR